MMELDLKNTTDYFDALLDIAVNNGSIYEVELGLSGNRENEYLNYCNNSYPNQTLFAEVFVIVFEDLSEKFVVSVPEYEEHANYFIFENRSDAIAYADSLEYSLNDTIERQLELFKQEFDKLDYTYEIEVVKAYNDGDFYRFEVSIKHPILNEWFLVNSRKLDMELIAELLNEQIIDELFLSSDIESYNEFTNDESNYKKYLF